jgi:hypothetical protein
LINNLISPNSYLQYQLQDVLRDPLTQDDLQQDVSRGQYIFDYITFCKEQLNDAMISDECSLKRKLNKFICFYLNFFIFKGSNEETLESVPAKSKKKQNF